MMGIFAAAAFRLIPATNRIIGTFQLVQYSAPVIRTLYTELSLPVPPPSSPERPADFDHWREIGIEHGSFRYADTGGWILRDIDLTIGVAISSGSSGRRGSGRRRWWMCFSASFRCRPVGSPWTARMLPIT